MKLKNFIPLYRKVMELNSSSHDLRIKKTLFMSKNKIQNKELPIFFFQENVQFFRVINVTLSLFCFTNKYKVDRGFFYVTSVLTLHYADYSINGGLETFQSK